MTAYDYFTAFKRNLGFLNKTEQQKLRDSRVAVVGLGGRVVLRSTHWPAWG